MNLTRERIRQVETRGLAKLRAIAEDEPAHPAAAPTSPTERSTTGAGELRDAAAGSERGRAPPLAALKAPPARATRAPPSRRCSTWSAAPSSPSPTRPVSSRSRGGSPRSASSSSPPAGTQRALADAGVPVVSVGDYTQAPGDPRRPREDAPPARARRDPLPARARLGRGGREGAGHPADRPRRREPLPVPRGGRGRASRSPSASRRSTSAARRWSAAPRRTPRTWASSSTPPTTSAVAAELEASRRALGRDALPPHAEGLRAHRRVRRRHLRVPHARARRPTRAPARFPATLAAVYAKAQDLRYGENPHQAGAFYRAGREPEEPTVAFAKVLQGKELSYNNLLDLEAALAAVKEFDEVACVVIKHNTPCGVSLGRDAGRGVRPRARVRSGLRVRRHRRAEPARGRRGREGAHRPLPRVRHRARRTTTRRAPRSPRRRTCACSRRRGSRQPRASWSAPAGGAARAALHRGRPARDGPRPRRRPPRGLQGDDEARADRARSGRTSSSRGRS